MPYRTGQFAFVKGSKTLVADASDLPGFNAQQSLRVVSDITGKEMVYLFHEEEKGEEGETISWHYNADGTKTKLIVFND